MAGAGGTSWAKVEGERAKDPRQRRLGQTFADWGLPTSDCIIGVRAKLLRNAIANAPKIPLIASGGLRNGLDVAKCLALGADIAGLAWPFLQAAADSDKAVAELADILIEEIAIVLFCTGNATIADLKQSNALEKIK